MEEKQILEFMKQKGYVPMKAKELAIIFDVHKDNIEELTNKSKITRDKVRGKRIGNLG